MTVEQLIQKLQRCNLKAKVTISVYGVEEEEITYHVADVASPTPPSCIISLEESGEVPGFKMLRSSEKQINFCDDCIHFRPIKPGEENPDNELCEFVRDLKFKCGYSYTGDDTGFYFPDCKDFEKE